MRTEESDINNDLAGLALIEDGIAGASRFKDGLGRHGDFAKIR
jgi:hypothetical protein